MKALELILMTSYIFLLQLRHVIVTILVYFLFEQSQKILNLVMPV